MATQFIASRQAVFGKPPTRRVFLVGGAAFAYAMVTPVIVADYPERALRLIVPTAPGSEPDIVARMVGERIAKAFGQPIVVEKRPGGGTIGLQAVARSAPDGYTLGLQTLSYVIAPRLLATVPYEIERDLRTVALLAQQSGTTLAHLPYKGCPAAQTALLAGEIDVIAGSVGFTAMNARAGKIRPLAIEGRVAAQRASRRVARLLSLEGQEPLGRVGGAGRRGRHQRADRWRQERARGNEGSTRRPGHCCQAPRRHGRVDAWGGTWRCSGIRLHVRESRHRRRWRLRRTDQRPAHGF